MDTKVTFRVEESNGPEKVQEGRFATKVVFLNKLAKFILVF